MMFKNYLTRYCFTALSAFAVLGSWMPRMAKACSPLPGNTSPDFGTLVDSAQYVDFLYVFGRIKLVDGVYGGPVEPGTPLEMDTDDTYYLAYIWDSYKGCSPSTTISPYFYLAYRHGFGLCTPAEISPGWYVMGTQDHSTNPQYRHPSNGIRIPWESFTYDQYTTLQALPPTSCAP